MNEKNIYKLFLTEESEELTKNIINFSPAFIKWLKFRTKYLDDIVKNEIKADTKQFIELGAGL